MLYYIPSAALSIFLMHVNDIGLIVQIPHDVWELKIRIETRE